MQLSWMLASGMISCKVEAASGPFAVSRERALPGTTDPFIRWL